MVKILFATSNAGKVREARFALAPLGIGVERVEVELREEQGESVEEVARAKAIDAFEIVGRPVAVEDTGFFITAFKGFPGVYSKPVMKAIGRSGILKLVDGTDGKAEFRTAVAFAKNRADVEIFSGAAAGRVADAAMGESADSLPYDSLFIPAGARKTYAQMGEGEKLSNSSRAVAFRKLGEFILSGKKTRGFELK
ncbi:non-canonical purine NTP pyrophosphatase [Candidatus Micrarchaeota archaeon]|nr:non-canonical purine NTP pyrophosphatase [Candidatus Micrarchaeota archaeon]MBI5177247.1 non-canonical purine NTP pyrophosphatase [Candidatus Micrarchaeota archaeon]